MAHGMAVDGEMGVEEREMGREREGEDLPEKIEFIPPSIPLSVYAKAPPFYNWEEIFGFLAAFRRHWRVIASEVEKISQPWHAWPESSLYGEGKDWKVVPFVYTFPATDPSRTKWVEPCCALAPNTVKLLRALPGVRTALFSRMGPGLTLVPHRGWAELSNHVLRCHLALDVPELKEGEEAVDAIDSFGVHHGGDGKEGMCGVSVEREDDGKYDTRFHKPGEIIVFDDSQVHTAFNKHPTKSRTVLIFDLPRPKDLAPGTADVGKTEELQGFIERFTAGIQ